MHKHIQTVQFANAQTHTYRSWSGNISYYPQNIPHILFSHEYIYTNIVYIIIYIRSLSATHTNVYTRPTTPTTHPTNKYILYFIYLYSIDFLQLPYLSQAIYLWVMIRIPNFVYMLWYFFFSRPIHSLLCTRWTGSNVNIRVLLPADVSCNRSSYWWNICPHSDHRNCLFCSTEKVKVWNIISIINLHIKNNIKTTISKMRESELFCWYM